MKVKCHFCKVERDEAAMTSFSHLPGLHICDECNDIMEAIAEHVIERREQAELSDYHDY